MLVAFICECGIIRARIIPNQLWLFGVNLLSISVAALALVADIVTIYPFIALGETAMTATVFTEIFVLVTCGCALRAANLMQS